MTNKLFLVAFLIASMGASPAEDHCSLIVKVVNLQDLEVEAFITVTEKNGRVHKKENEIGGARFCDLGILPVTLVVGKGLCQQVTVRDVQLTWRKTTLLKVIYQREPCMSDSPRSPEPGCDVLLRIIDKQRTAISGASVRLKLSPQQEFTADPHGRVMLGAKSGSNLEGTVIREGYLPVDFKFPCSRGDSLQEHYLVLENAPK
ncbi:MAG: hypothetical protein AB1898_25160 [Acidobacteriota bacterium]